MDGDGDGEEGRKGVCVEGEGRETGVGFTVD